VVAGLLQLFLFMLLVVLLGRLRPKLLGVAGEKAVSRALRRMFAEVLDDVILPDGRGGLTQIDHVALTPAGLLVVETKNYGGSIFGQAYEATWTQAIGGQRNRFQNPLRQNFAHIEAVKLHAPGVLVQGRVVFTNRARFPKGMPEGVVALSDLRYCLQNLLGGDIPPPTRVAWDRLRGAVRADHGARAEHLDGIKQRRRAAGNRPTNRGSSRPGRRMVHAVVALTSVVFGLLTLSMLAQLPVGTERPPSEGIAFATRAPVSASQAEQRIAGTLPPPKGAARPGSVAQQRAAVDRPHIEWSTPTQPSQRKAACNAAIAALLADNTPEHRRQREKLCGAEAGRGASPDSAVAVLPAAQVEVTSRVLRSAAELASERGRP